jgi:hypothetical protein
MTDPLRDITQQEDLLGKIRSFVNGFVGYFDRETRREADRLLRETVAQRFEQQWSRVSEVQRELVSSGQLQPVGALEAAALKLRAFVDRIEGAASGYAGFFDTTRINKPELEKLYAYDLELLQKADVLRTAVDELYAALGQDGLPAAIQRVLVVSQDAVDMFDRRSQAIMTG